MPIADAEVQVVTADADVAPNCNADASVEVMQTVCFGDLEICAVSVMHSKPNQRKGYRHVEEEGTCPLMLLIICVQGEYQVQSFHPDRPSKVYIIKLKEG